jgi:hypothetical protein
VGKRRIYRSKRSRVLINNNPELHSESVAKHIKLIEIVTRFDGLFMRSTSGKIPELEVQRNINRGVMTLKSCMK